MRSIPKLPVRFFLLMLPAVVVTLASLLLLLSTPAAGSSEQTIQFGQPLVHSPGTRPVMVLPGWIGGNDPGRTSDKQTGERLPLEIGSSQTFSVAPDDRTSLQANVQPAADETAPPAGRPTAGRSAGRQFEP